MNTRTDTYVGDTFSVVVIHEPDKTVSIAFIGSSNMRNVVKRTRNETARFLRDIRHLVKKVKQYASD